MHNIIDKKFRLEDNYMNKHLYKVMESTCKTLVTPNK